VVYSCLLGGDAGDRNIKNEKDCSYALKVCDCTYTNSKEYSMMSTLHKASQAYSAIDSSLLNHIPLEPTLLSAFQSPRSYNYLLSHPVGRSCTSRDVTVDNAIGLINTLEFIHTHESKVLMNIKPPNLICDAEGHMRFIDFGSYRALTASFSPRPQAYPGKCVNFYDNCRAYSSPRMQKIFLRGRYSLCYTVYPTDDLVSLVLTLYDIKYQLSSNRTPITHVDTFHNLWKHSLKRPWRELVYTLQNVPFETWPRTEKCLMKRKAPYERAREFMLRELT